MAVAFALAAALALALGLAWSTRVLGSLVCRAISKTRSPEPSPNIVRLGELRVVRVEQRVGCLVWVVGDEREDGGRGSNSRNCATLYAAT